MKIVQHLAHLSWPERYIAAEAWLIMLWVGVGLRTHWRTRLFVTNGTTGEPRLSQAQVRHVAQLVNEVANHHVRGMTCLERALTLQLLLSRRGCRANLRFGVYKSDTMIEAHAWLEGIPGLNDQLSSKFASLKKCSERHQSS
jgi:hypothetical protein